MCMIRLHQINSSSLDGKPRGRLARRLYWSPSKPSGWITAFFHWQRHSKPLPPKGRWSLIPRGVKRSLFVQWSICQIWNTCEIWPISKLYQNYPFIKMYSKEYSWVYSINNNTVTPFICRGHVPTPNGHLKPQVPNLYMLFFPICAYIW